MQALVQSGPAGMAASAPLFPALGSIIVGAVVLFVLRWWLFGVLQKGVMWIKRHNDQYREIADRLAAHVQHRCQVRLLHLHAAESELPLPRTAWLRTAIHT